MRKPLPIAVAAAVVVVAVLVASPWASGSSRAPAAAPQVLGYSSYELGPVSFTPTPQTVGTLELPKGKYLVDAKVVVEVASGPADVTCRLAGAAVDVAMDEQLRSDADGIETLPLVAGAVLAAKGKIDVVCVVNGGTAYASAVSITAVKVTTLKATAVG
jgi:hypothetical protein